MIFAPFIPPEKEEIHYKCGKCGRDTISESVLQCPVCYTSLCDQCSNFSFCNEHFNLLSPDDRKTVIENFRLKPSGYNSRFLIATVIGLLVMGLGALLLFRNIDFKGFDSPIIVFLIIGLISSVGIVAILLAKGRIHSKNGRFEYIAAQIAKNYQPSPEPNDYKTYSSKKAVNLKYCSKCGSLSENGGFCPQCGDKLI